MRTGIGVQTRQKGKRLVAKSIGAAMTGDEEAVDESGLGWSDIPATLDDLLDMQFRLV